MDKEKVYTLYEFATSNPKHFLYLVLIIISIIGAIFYTIYSIQISNKNELLNINFNTQKENLESQFKIKEEGFLTDIKKVTSERDTYKLDFERKERKIITDEINSGALNITISNNNVNQNVGEIILNASCNEKDYFIGELSKKVNDKDKALSLCIQNNFNQSSEIEELKILIPAYETGFVGKDIKVGKGGSYQADGGKFTLGVREVYSHSGTANYYTIFVLNGIEYRKNLGQSVTFTYVDGSNYTINVRGTGNPALFYVYKNE